MKKWIFISIAVVVLVGGVGVYWLLTKTHTTANSTTTTTTVAFSDPCKVFKKADIDAAFGVPFQAGKKEGASIAPRGATIASCKYDQATDGSPAALIKALNFSIDVETHETSDDAQSAIEATKSTATLGGKTYFVKTDVPGIGDDAFFFDGKASGVQNTEEYMYARKGSQILHLIAIKIDGVDHQKAQQAMKTLTKKALH
jgi:hypothetical protein